MDRRTASTCRLPAIFHRHYREQDMTQDLDTHISHAFNDDLIRIRQMTLDMAAW